MVPAAYSLALRYIITEGGTAVNVVPERAVVTLTYRDVDRERVNKGVAWIKDMVKGAGLANQTEAQTFASKLQEAVGLKPTGMTSQIDPIPNEPTKGGFSDVGDVSYITPTMGLTVPGVPQGIGLHTWMATASHGTSIGFKGAVTASKVLALTGIDLLLDAELREQAKADFDKRTEGYNYQSPIPDIIKEPSGLPDDMRSYGTRSQLKGTFLKHGGDHSWDADSQGHPHEH